MGCLENEDPKTPTTLGLKTNFFVDLKIISQKTFRITPASRLNYNEYFIIIFVSKLRVEGFGLLFSSFRGLRSSFAKIARNLKKIQQIPVNSQSS